MSPRCGRAKARPSSATANYLKVLQGLKVTWSPSTITWWLRTPVLPAHLRPAGHFRRYHVRHETYGAEAEIRREAYNCDITYGTNSEFGFDYLRDNMKHSARDQMQGRQDYVVVDEVDSILIDEARTPLIISGPAHDDVSNYRVADNIARMLIAKQQAANRETARRLNDLEQNPPPEARNNPKFYDGIKKFRADPLWLSSEEAEAIGHMQYFVVELDRKSAHMTEHGAKAAQAELAIGTFYDTKNMNWPHYIDNALRAHLAYQKDKEYVAVDDQIIIVDEFTGHDARPAMVGRSAERSGRKRSRSSGDADAANAEPVQDVPAACGDDRHRDDRSRRVHEDLQARGHRHPDQPAGACIDYNDKIYKTRGSKLDALVEEIRAYSQKGYPADAYSLLDMLKMARRTLVSLRDANGNGQAPEAASVAQASLPGLERIDEQIRIADEAIRAFGNGEGDEAALYAGLEEGYRKLMGSNVGGRPVLVGTTSVEASEELSQLLSRRYGIEHEVLNARHHAREAEIVAKAGQQHEVVRGKKKEMHGNVTIATNMAGRGTDIVLGPGVAAIGGLHVVGTERHESRRIDNQLRGRCGRQGDPGSSRFFLSMEDELLHLHGQWMLKMLNMLGFGGHGDRRRRISRASSGPRRSKSASASAEPARIRRGDGQRRSRSTPCGSRWSVRTLGDDLADDRRVGRRRDRSFYDRNTGDLRGEWVGQNLNVPIEVTSSTRATGLKNSARRFAIWR